MTKLSEKYEQLLGSSVFPEKPRKPVKQNYDTNETYGKALDLYEILVDDYDAGIKLWKEERARIIQEFKKELLDELGITSHPRADKLWELAWQEGHSSGLREVETYADMFVVLLRD